MRTPVIGDELRDRIEIDDLVTAYAVAVDGRDWEALADLFTADAVLDYSAFDGPRAPVGEAIGWVRAGLEGFPISQHLQVNRQVWLEGNTARGRCAVFNPMVDANGALVQVGGYYDDRFVRTSEGWRFAERVATPTWSTFG